MFPECMCVGYIHKWSIRMSEYMEWYAYVHILGVYIIYLTS